MYVRNFKNVFSLRRFTARFSMKMPSYNSPGVREVFLLCFFRGARTEKGWTPLLYFNEVLGKKIFKDRVCDKLQNQNITETFSEKVR